MNKITELTSFALVTSLLLSQTAIAEESLSDRVQGCVQIIQDTPRLACFDQLTVKHSVKNVDLKVTQLTAQQVDSFSKEQVKKTAEELAKEIKSITLTISELNKTIHKKWKITFNNGQKWLQKDNSRLKLKQGDKVTLTKGALGSVYLRKENITKSIKVKRLK